MLTFVPIEEIEEMEKHMEGAEYNKAKELLAYELTKLVHGKEEADKADAAAKAILQAVETAMICLARLLLRLILLTAR